MKTAIVEDEPIAQRNLVRLLETYAPDIEVVAILPSVEAALAWFAVHPRPDFGLFDVQLGDGTSFEILGAMPLQLPIVFTTAYDQYALRAFEAYGIDYLLKPIDPLRFNSAIAKVRRLLQAGNAAAAPAALDQHYLTAAQHYKTRFLVHTGQRIASIPVENIAYFRKEATTRLVTFDGQGFSVDATLDELEKLLDPTAFFRANRQCLVHIRSVRAAFPASKGRLDVKLEPDPGSEVTISQARAVAFRAWLDR